MAVENISAAVDKMNPISRKTSAKNFVPSILAPKFITTTVRVIHAAWTQSEKSGISRIKSF